MLCDELEAPEYGRIIYSNGRYFNSTATYTCDYCYTIDRSSGDTKRLCQDYGEWTGKAPKCISKLPKPCSQDMQSVFANYLQTSGLHLDQYCSSTIDGDLFVISACCRNRLWETGGPTQWQRLAEWDGPACQGCVQLCGHPHLAGDENKVVSGGWEVGGVRTSLRAKG